MNRIDRECTRRHEALITPELFDRVQQVIDARVKRGQRDRVHNHFARGMLHCGRCHDVGKEHRLIFTEAKNHADQIYEYFMCRGRQDRLCDLPFLPSLEVERALTREFASLRLSPEAIESAKGKVRAALRHVLARQEEQRARLQKELKKLEVQEERLVDLAADGALPTDKLRSRLRDLQIKKHEIRAGLDTTTESLQQRTEMVLSYLDLMARPDALFTAATGAVKRKLLAAFFGHIWVNDDGHLLHVSREFQPLVADIRDAALNSAPTPTNTKSAGEISDASSVERLNLYLKVICLSKTSLVGAVHNNSSKSSGHLAPTLPELQKLASRAATTSAPAEPIAHSPRTLNRRIRPETWEEIVAKYKAGATSPELCVEYGLSKTGLLNYLHDRGVQLRRQPLASEQVEEATRLYSHGFSIAAIANYFDTSYNNVRQNFERLGIERRPRGGSQPKPKTPRSSLLDERQRMIAVLLYTAGGPLEAVAAEVGTTIRAVRVCLIDAGVPLRTRGRPARRSEVPAIIEGVRPAVVISTASQLVGEGA